MGYLRSARLVSACLSASLASVVVVGLVSGCAAPRASAITTPSPSPTATAIPTATPIPRGNLAQVQLGLAPFASGLVRPDYLTHANDGSGRVYILEQAGRIRVAEANGQVHAEPFLDIRSMTQWYGELGLMSLAFHPRFTTNGLFFISYSNLDGDTVIARYQIANGNPLRADPSSRKVILVIEEPDIPEHKSGMLAFGPDGYLYIGSGDGGRGAPGANGQRKDTLLGKILRIDVDHTDAGKAYAVPADNPFVADHSGSGEIWAYGLRNPWRFSFDRVTGNLFIGDVGDSTYEEIDVQRATSHGGENYGWKVYEGNACLQASCSPPSYVGPIATYQHKVDRCAVIGGYVYRGKRYSALQGIYLFGDLCSGRIYGLTAADAVPGKPSAYRELLNSSAYLSSFGEDESGEVYLIDLHGGTVYRVTAK